MTCETQGTTSVEGLCTLTLGNSSGKTTGGNATGKIKIYNGASNGFVNIYGEYSDNRSQIEVGGYLSVLNGIYLKDSDKTIIGSLTCSIKGTTATHGYCRLILGNTKNSGTAGNSSGEIWLYAPHNANTS